MEKRNSLILAAVILALLGFVMIYLGAFYGPKIMLPPVVTGIGFFVIAWAFIKMKR